MMQPAIRLQFAIFVFQCDVGVCVMGVCVIRYCAFIACCCKFNQFPEAEERFDEFMATFVSDNASAVRPSRPKP
jgi:pentatricopeptide repeat protein